MFPEKNKRGTRSTVHVAVTTAAAAATAAEAEVFLVSAVVTAAAGHTRRGPGQGRSACVSSINPLKIATAVVPRFFRLISVMIEDGQSASPITKTHGMSEYVLHTNC